MLCNAQRVCFSLYLQHILAAANQTMADQLKTETDQLLDTVLYTVSMKMKNGFNRSDN